MNKIKWLFFLLISFLSIFYVDLWRNANTVSRLLPVKAFVEDGTWTIDKFHEETIDKALINGHYYSEKAPLPALIVLPAYALIYKSGIAGLMKGDDMLYFAGAVMVGVIPFIIIVMLIFTSLLNRGWNIYKSMTVTMLLSFSTYIFVYAGTAFSHVMAGLWILLSYIFIRERKKYFMAGLFAGLAFLTEYPAGILLIIWPVILTLKTKKVTPAFVFAVGSFPAVLFQLVYNYHFTGDALDMLYNHPALELFSHNKKFMGFTLPIGEALWKLMFGFYRGWLIHAAVLILFFAMIVKQLIKTPVEMITDYLIPYLTASYILFSSFKIWYGGWCFGPRHLVPATILLLYHFAGYMGSKKIVVYSFYVLAFAGIIYTWLAKSTLLYNINADYPNPLTELIIPAFLHHNFNENNILTYLFGINAGIAALIWLAVLLAAVIFTLKKSSALPALKPQIRL